MRADEPPIGKYEGQLYYADSIIEQQASLSSFLATPKNATTANRRRYSNIESLWSEVMNRQALPGDKIMLESALLLEWMPRSPGLYHSPGAVRSRARAYDHILARTHQGIVFDPNGKQSMLDGGIGNVRLKPISINGNEMRLCGACFDGVCHKGFPVAVPEILFSEFQHQIAGSGAVRRDLAGTLRFVPDNLSRLYMRSTGIPQLYIELDEPDVLRGMEDDIGTQLELTLAALFKTPDDDRFKATFVTTEPNFVSEGAAWIRETYVQGRYGGTVVTDFDQQQRHFPEAIFSLDKVMSLNITDEDGSVVQSDLRMILEHQQLIAAREVYMSGSSKYHISGGQQGAVGDNARAENFQQNQSIEQSFDAAELAHELVRVIEAMRKNASEPEEIAAVGNVEAAKKAAEKGDKPKALQFLKNAGQWALDAATDIGTSVAAEVIKKSMSM
jgi:hypothetical protein